MLCAKVFQERFSHRPVRLNWTWLWGGDRRYLLRQEAAATWSWFSDSQSPTRIALIRMEVKIWKGRVHSGNGNCSLFASKPLKVGRCRYLRSLFPLNPGSLHDFSLCNPVGPRNLCKGCRVAVDTGTSELAGGGRFPYLWKFQISRFGVLFFEVLLTSSTSWSSAEPSHNIWSWGLQGQWLAHHAAMWATTTNHTNCLFVRCCSEQRTCGNFWSSKNTQPFDEDAHTNWPMPQPLCIFLLLILLPERIEMDSGFCRSMTATAWTVGHGCGHGYVALTLP